MVSVYWTGVWCMFVYLYTIHKSFFSLVIFSLVGHQIKLLPTKDKTQCLFIFCFVIVAGCIQNEFYLFLCLHWLNPKQQHRKRDRYREKASKRDSMTVSSANALFFLSLQKRRKKKLTFHTEQSLISLRFSRLLFFLYVSRFAFSNLLQTKMYVYCMWKYAVEKNGWNGCCWFGVCCVLCVDKVNDTIKIEIADFRCIATGVVVCCFQLLVYYLDKNCVLSATQFSCAITITKPAAAIQCCLKSCFFFAASVDQCRLIVNMQIFIWKKEIFAERVDNSHCNNNNKITYFQRITLFPIFSQFHC